MRNANLLAPCLALLLCGVLGVGFGCAGDESNGDDDDDSNCDPICPEDGGPDSDTDTDVDTDVDTDTDTDTDTDGDCDDNCIDVADPAIPPCSDIGDPCRDNRDCQLGFFCVEDSRGYPDGYCLAGGPEGSGACDQDLPASCPVGSSCTYGGRDTDGRSHYYCYKDCNISDRNPWDTSSCGCRDGYSCDLLSEICYPGCTEANVDEDCCRYWADPNGDFINDGAAEWDDVPDCTQTCNEDAFRCVNPGDPDAEWGDSCTFNQDCPEEGYCRREQDRDGNPDTVGNFFVDGYCYGFGCDLGGRGCGDNCRNLGSSDDPAWLCVEICELAPEGADPWVANADCRADYSCFGDPSDPDAEKNGFCWTPARYNDIREPNIGEPCEDADECYSPFGQGVCFAERGGAGWLEGSCGVASCDFPGMEGYCDEADGYICEVFGGGYAYCLDRCTDPGGGFGTDVGCRDDNYACYASGVSDDGICFPSCIAQPDSGDFCDSFFNGAPNCNEVTGICEP